MQFKSHYKPVVYHTATTIVCVLLIGSVFALTLCHPSLWDIPCRSQSANDCSTQLKICDCTILNVNSYKSLSFQYDYSK